MGTCDTCGSERRSAPARVRWSIRLALLGITFAVAFLAVAPLAIGMLEGVRDGFAPARGAAALTIVLALAAVLAGVVRLRRPLCDACGTTEPAWIFEPAPGARESAPGSATDRRSFLAAAGAIGASGVAAAVAAVGGFVAGKREWLPIADEIFLGPVVKTHPTRHPEWAGARVQNYRRLGRTNAMVSDISLGSGKIQDKAVAIDAIDRGVNYFDTAPDYAHTTSERILGEAIRETGGRDQMFLASKFCTSDGHLPADASVEQIMAAVEGSLTRLGTDYLDLIHIHSCDVMERLMAPSFHEAFDRLRDQGKARFLGVSTHTPNLQAIARQAIVSDRFDVMMLAYHYGLFPQIGRIIDQAHAKDVGVVAMKTLKGGRAADLAGFEDEAGSYAQASFRWVLSNPSVSCLVVSFFDEQHCDEYLYASGTQPRPTDRAVLEKYDRLVTADYCRPHCGACLDTCERGLPIDTVLRYDMYFEGYRGRRALAREKYAALSGAGLDASGCAACPAPCAGACPFELPIRAKMVRAHERLRPA